MKKPIKITKDERYDIYLPMLAEGCTRAEISRRTGINISTVKADLWKLSKNNHSQHIERGPEITEAITNNTPGNNWNENLDEMGKIIMGIFRQTISKNFPCPHCKGPISISDNNSQAHKWASTFGRLYQARQGAIRLNFTDARTLNIDHLKENKMFIQLVSDERTKIVQAIYDILEKNLDEDTLMKIENEIIESE